MVFVCIAHGVQLAVPASLPSSEEELDQMLSFQVESERTSDQNRIVELFQSAKRNDGIGVESNTASARV